MTGVAFFDINETTLDLLPVRRVVNELLGHHAGFTNWFQRLLQLSMTTTATGSYSDFTALAQAALRAVADAGDRPLAADGWAQVASAMGALDPYPDVRPGLLALRAAGWSTVALTNSAPATVAAQLDRAELTALFDRVLSVDAVRVYKPAPTPYRYAAEQAGVDPSEAWMVACHDWDLAGARAVGMSTAFVTRPNMSYAPNYPAADLAVDDFCDLAARLTAPLDRPPR